MVDDSKPVSGVRPLPYVYRLTHRETGKFYIGSRCANVRKGLRAEDDLGRTYKSSSRIIKPHFDEYDAVVLVECFTREFAFEIENEMIEEVIHNPLCLNKCVWRNANYAIVGSRLGKKLSDEQRKRIGEVQRGRKISAETREKKSRAMTGKKIVWSEEARRNFKKIRASIYTPEWRQRLSDAQKKRFAKPEELDKIRKTQGRAIEAKRRGSKLLRVSTGNGRVSVIYASATVFAKAAKFTPSSVYVRANKFSGIESTRGKLKGLAFSFVDC